MLTLLLFINGKNIHAQLSPIQGAGCAAFSTAIVSVAISKILNKKKMNKKKYKKALLKACYDSCIVGLFSYYISYELKNDGDFGFFRDIFSKISFRSFTFSF